MNLTKPLRSRAVRVVTAVVAVVVVAALYLEPWKLVVDERVLETAPISATELARGSLISHEHESSGMVVLLRLPDGSRVLRLEDLRTSNGPRLKVWLSDAPVLVGTEGWAVFDDGRYADLGYLKGNIGSSDYPIPADVDLASLPSVSIWCARFHVSFAATTLKPVG